ncbi:MAG: type II toxin-antitoxin system VapC family toxin, partial [Thermodesulfovibrionales bacterium]|nr:type II toxin-antitoxin system VapC family toxin [Thermodesulfovibrionales bacterium]
MIYFDSSAMVKRYLDEEGSYTVNKMLDEASVAATSILTYPKMVSAFIRKQRMREISKDTYAKISSALESEWSYFFVIQFSDQLYPAIRRIIE